jgi:hypothetical protein
MARKPSPSTIERLRTEAEKLRPLAERVRPELKKLRSHTEGLRPLQRLRDRLTPSTPPPAPASAPRRRLRSAPQFDRAKWALKNLYPPDGEVPSAVPTDRVRAQVETFLEPEGRKLGLEAPSRKVINRALGRSQK